MKIDVDGFLPLAPATLHILLALASENLHGYGIMQEVARQSEGRYKLGPGTLYGCLKRMLAAGFIAESDERPDPEPGVFGLPVKFADQAEGQRAEDRSIGHEFAQSGLYSGC